MEGKNYSFGSGVGGYQSTIGGNGNEKIEFTDENPSPITLMFESKNAKAKREQRIELQKNINSIFSEIVPKYEQTKWVQTEKFVDDEGYAMAIWKPHTEKDQTLRIEYQELSNSLEKNISELIQSNNKKMLSDETFSYTINEIEKTKDSAIFEVDEFKKGVSNTIKKNTQVKSLEKWIIYGNWLIKLSYNFFSAGNQEKNETWIELRNTWEIRFSKIHFSMEKSV